MMEDEIELIEDQAVDTPEELEETQKELGENPESLEAEEDLVVSIGDEEPPQEEQGHAPEWVRELRKTNRELRRQNQELHGRLQQSAPQQTVSLGKEPTLEDYDYDAEEFKKAYKGWFEQKRSVDEQQARQEAEIEKQNRAWQEKLAGYSKSRAELRVKDFEEAESVTQETLNVVQQGVILQGAENPALIVYALGKRPKKAQELAEIKDPVKFAFAVAKLEKELKVTSKKPTTLPEKTIVGGAKISGSIDSTLERLRAEAAKTGDNSKVNAYKRQKKA
jgi:hypothetical protein